MQRGQIYLLISLLFIVSGTKAQVSIAEQQSINTIIDTTEIKKSINYSTTLHNTDSAIAILQASLHDSRNAKYVHGVVLSLFHLGELYSENSMYEKALTMYEEAIFYCQSSPVEAFLLARIYNNVSSIYKYLDNYENATVYLYKAALSNFSLKYIYNNFASILISSGQLSQAMSYLNKAQVLAEKDKDKNMQAGILLNKGVISIKGKNWAEGQAYYESALKISTDNHIVSTQKLALINLGDIYLTQNKPEQALPYYLKGLTVKYPENLIYDNMNKAMLGKTYCLLHYPSIGKRYLEEALVEAKKFRMGENCIAINKLLSEVSYQKGSYKDAYQYYKVYTALKDSLENIEKIKNLNQVEVRYRVSEKDKDIIKKQFLIDQQQIRISSGSFWILITSLGALLLSITLLLLFVLYRNNRHKQQLQGKQIHILQQEQQIVRLNALMEGEEKERSRLARELHDGIGGMLASVRLNLGSVKEKHPETSHIKKLDDVMDMLKDVSIEIRKTAHNLLPGILVEHTLEEALLIYCNNVNGGGKVNIDLQFNVTDIGQLNKGIELMLYRIAQELIQNIIKHANATYAVIQMIQKRGKLSVMVEDNGTGFDVNEINNGYGLQNLQFRIQALEGYISIMSAKGRNTTIHIEFDLEKLKHSASI